MIPYDTDLMMPPSFSHVIHEALVDREEPSVREERDADRVPDQLEARAAVLAARRSGTSVRGEADLRIRARHGGPGNAQVVRVETVARLPDHVTSRVAVRQGRPLIWNGGGVIRGQCPICPRHVHSWALTDLRGVGDPVRSATRETRLSPASPVGSRPPYACDACKTGMIRAGLFTKSQWCEAFGAPPEIVRHHRVVERAKEIVQERAQAGLTWKPQDVKAQADRDVPALEVFR